MKHKKLYGYLQYKRTQDNYTLFEQVLHGKLLFCEKYKM